MLCVCVGEVSVKDRVGGGDWCSVAGALVHLFTDCIRSVCGGVGVREGVRVC